VDSFFGSIALTHFSQLRNSCYGRIRAFLAINGTPIGPYDLQIAAIALANNLTVVTHNIREFSRVPQLNLEDWEAG